jgi:hypothetical protein
MQQLQKVWSSNYVNVLYSARISAECSVSVTRKWIHINIIHKHIVHVHVHCTQYVLLPRLRVAALNGAHTRADAL